MKQLLFSLLTLLPMAASAVTVEIGGIYYNLIDKGNVAEVTSNPNKYTGNVTIPESITYDGIEYSVTTIGEKAFNLCSNLTSLTIPSSVTIVGSMAFWKCDGLTSVHISDLEAWCKISFSNLNSNPLYCAHHLYLNGTEIKDLVIPNSVTWIPNYTFSGCTGLTSANIPNSVTSIGIYAFQNCTSLTSITFPNGVQHINYNAFEGCSGLTSITIPNSLTSIDNYVFSGCSGLTSVTIPNSVSRLLPHAFYNCSNLTSVIIGSGVKSISDGVFASCPNLSDVYSLAEDVPSTIGQVFKDSYIEYATLHVPGSSINEYKTKSPWCNFKEIVSLDGSGAQKCATPAITYQGGKLKMSCSTEGVEFVTDITDADIKKHYDATISLTATYNISVYATKAGYDDSDVATITLCWIDQAPAISTGVAQVPAIPVVIKSDGGLLTIEGANDGTQVNVYTMDGMQVGAAISRDGQTHIATSLSAGSLAIVKIGDKSVKVAIR